VFLNIHCRLRDLHQFLSLAWQHFGRKYKFDRGQLFKTGKSDWFGKLSVRTASGCNHVPQLLVSLQDKVEERFLINLSVATSIDEVDGSSKTEAMQNILERR
jgi:hypothetical protein